MNSTTKENVEKLIEKLADVEEFDTEVGKQKVTHPVRIGDVLEKYDYWNWTKCAEYSDTEGYESHLDKLVFLWEPCGLTKSLQEIVEESGYEECEEPTREVDMNGDVCSWYVTEELKRPNARALFEFLLEIIPIEK